MGVCLGVLVGDLVGTEVGILVGRAVGSLRIGVSSGVKFGILRTGVSVSGVGAGAGAAVGLVVGTDLVRRTGVSVSGVGRTGMTIGFAGDVGVVLGLIFGVFTSGFGLTGVVGNRRVGIWSGRTGPSRCGNFGRGARVGNCRGLPGPGMSIDGCFGGAFFGAVFVTDLAPRPTLLPAPFTIDALDWVATLPAPPTTPIGTPPLKTSALPFSKVERFGSRDGGSFFGRMNRFVVGVAVATVFLLAALACSRSNASSAASPPWAAAASCADL